MNAAARRALLATAAAALVVVLVLLAEHRPQTADRKPQTPCPDAIACHALKRKSTPHP